MTWPRTLAVTGLLLAVLAAVASVVFLLGDGEPSVHPTTVPVTLSAEPGLPVLTPDPGDTASRSPAPTTTTFRFRDGLVVYRAPSPMRVNDVQRVTVLVLDEGAPFDLTSNIPGTGQVSVEQAKVGAALTADLSGPDFQITRVGGDDGKRELLEFGVAEWAWDVRPSKGGTLRLDFVLYVAKDTGGAPLRYRTWAHAVEVHVNVSYSFGKFVKEYGALTGLTVPVVAGAVWTFIRWLRKKREKSEPEPVEE